MRRPASRAALLLLLTASVITEAEEAPPANPPAAPSTADFRRLLERVEQLEQERLIQKQNAEIVRDKDVAQKKVSLGPVWKDGFNIQTADGAYRLHVGGLLQADARYFPGNTAAGPVDGFFIRRARIDLE